MKRMSGQDLELGKWLGAAAVGALVMYMLDPEHGAPRRAQSGEKLRELGRQTGSVIDKLVQGIGSQAGEAAGAVRQLRNAAGIGQAGEAPPQTSEASSGAMAPAMRNAAMLGGGALSLAGVLMRRSPLALALGVAGLTLLARGAGKRPLRDMLGMVGLGRADGQAIDIVKSIRIDATPEQVYDLWSRVENFPRFMANVVEVRDLGNRRSHWVVKGPAGAEFAWNALTTEQARPRRLAWRSEPGAEIAQSGRIEFAPVRGGTQVTLRMRYQPPAGAIGHAVATLLGSDPKRRMDEDLARMKALIERGSLPGNAGQLSGAESKFLH